MLLKLNKVLLITNGLLKNRGQKSKNGDEPKGSEETWQHSNIIILIPIYACQVKYHHQLVIVNIKISFHEPTTMLYVTDCARNQTVQLSRCHSNKYGFLSPS